jgi:uncharacterized RDD family membrane protein YckC
METRRWTNPSQPQTLYMATFLLYINAVFDVIFSGFNPIAVVIGAVQVAAGFGIANEKRWGYMLGIAVAGVRVLFALGLLIPLITAGALLALLLHPQSRGYQRIWFS